MQSALYAEKRRHSQRWIEGYPLYDREGIRRAPISSLYNVAQYTFSDTILMLRCTSAHPFMGYKKNPLAEGFYFYYLTSCQACRQVIYNLQARARTNSESVRKILP